VVSRQTGTRRRRSEIRIGAAGTTPGVGTALIRRAVRTVLEGERAESTIVYVNFLSSQRMRALNRRIFGKDRSTDVIAFGLPHHRTFVADVYVCPPAARRSAQAHGLPAREEIVRNIVHGTLHALGHEHPRDASRMASPMWRRQERYLQQVLGPLS
jgi:probable rRNA maturation factor